MKVYRFNTVEGKSMSGIWPAPTRTRAEVEDPSGRYSDAVAKAMKELKVDHAGMLNSNVALAVFRRAKQLDPDGAAQYREFVLSEER